MRQFLIASRTILLVRDVGESPANGAASMSAKSAWRSGSVSLSEAVRAGLEAGPNNQ
jgi:hypothetical protein